MKIQNISVIGLGKLGFPLAVCWANKGYNVIAVDLNKTLINLMNEGKAPYYEANLQELLNSSKMRLLATDDYEEAIKNTEITFIIVPTPSTEQGNFSNDAILAVCKSIGACLKNKSDFHIVVVTSTVMPGSMDNEIKPTLETSSGKKSGIDFGLCYNPEFIALGTVIRNLYNPDFLLIGESDERTGDILSSLYKTFCDNKPKIARMNFINAELTKLCVNTFVTMKISYANNLAQMCSALPGANVDVVTNALGFDARIGPKYLKGGLGFGGTCFPRDNHALLYLANKIGVKAFLAETTDNFNKQQLYRIAELIVSKLPENGTVGILGVAFKPDTEVVEESQGLLLGKLLITQNIPIIIYDPVAHERAKKQLTQANFASSSKECIKNSDVIVIATAWDEFKKLKPSNFSDNQVILDCWRILDSNEFKNVPNYIPYGVG